MTQKVTILTILVAALAFLSFFTVLTDIKSRAKISESRKISSGLALISASRANEETNSQKSYVLPVSEPTYFPIRNFDIPEPVLNSKAFLLYDTKNDKALFGKYSRKTLPVASLTKLLTAVIALEHLSPKDVVEVKKESMNVDGEGADFYLSEKIYFKDLLKAMLVKSSNDAASAVANAVELKSGRVFADLMNQKSFQIGMTNSKFLDPSGLNDAAYSTAEDLIKLWKYSKNFEEISNNLNLSFADFTSADGRFSHHMLSTNKLLGVLPNITGAKTGYTDGALGCIIIEERLISEDSFLVAVILGSESRFEDTKILLDWGKKAFRWR